MEILWKESFDQQAMQSNKVQKTKRVATKQGQSIYKSIMRREGKEERKKELMPMFSKIESTFKKVVDGWFGKYK